MTWRQLAEAFTEREDVVVAEVDCSLHHGLCRAQQVSQSQSSIVFYLLASL